MAGFPIQLPDGSTVNIVHKDGAEGIHERFTDENGNVYARNASGGMSRSFVLVEEAAVTLIGFEGGEEPSVDQDVTPVTEDEPADGGEVIEDEPADGYEVIEGEQSFGIEFEDGSTAEIELDAGDDPDSDPNADLDYSGLVRNDEDPELPDAA